jgi:hypothetical protein
MHRDYFGARYEGPEGVNSDTGHWLFWNSDMGHWGSNMDIDIDIDHHAPRPGFEPWTFGMQGGSSTIELHPWLFL